MALAFFSIVSPFPISVFILFYFVLFLSSVALTVVPTFQSTVGSAGARMVIALPVVNWVLPKSILRDYVEPSSSLPGLPSLSLPLTTFRNVKDADDSHEPLGSRILDTSSQDPRSVDALLDLRCYALSMVFFKLDLILHNQSLISTFTSPLFLMLFYVTSLLYCIGHCFGLYALLLFPIKNGIGIALLFRNFAFLLQLTIIDGWVFAFSTAFHVLRFEFVGDPSSFENGLELINKTKLHPDRGGGTLIIPSEQHATVFHPALASSEPPAQHQLIRRRTNRDSTCWKS